MNIISRRSFLERSMLTGAVAGLGALTNVPMVVKRALAAGIGQGSFAGKKLFFLFLRGANDGLNALMPYGDTNYINLSTGATPIRPNILIPRDALTDYTNTHDIELLQNPAPSDPDDPANPGVYTGASNSFARGLDVGNGFSALHPSLKFMAPIYKAGDLAMVHRVGYPKQSRSHFDSQNYWEIGQPGDNVDKQGIFFRAMYEYLLQNPNAGLTGVTIQSALPLSMRGTGAAMTNLADTTRYDLLGIPHNFVNGPSGTNYYGDIKALTNLAQLQNASFPTKKSRDLLQTQYKNVLDTLTVFSGIDFTEGADVITPPHSNPANFVGNEFVDDVATDNDRPYYLFPTTNIKNGGWRRPGGANQFNKYVIPTGQQTFMKSVKSAALILNKTDAIIAGTEIGGWDLHNNEVTSAALTTEGAHADLLRTVGWIYYALYKFFKIYGKNGSNPMPGAKCSWNDVVVITMSEFGRTTIGNSTLGTDHAEAVAMFVAGGAVHGYNKAGNTNGASSGVYCMHTTAANSTYNGNNVKWNVGSYTAGAQTGTGTLFDATGRYLQRAVDYRSVLGELFRDHLGATDGTGGSVDQLGNILPGYTVAGEHLKTGGLVTTPIDSSPTTIAGELNLV
ncbi:MAG TPA: DUF1501 domain-containing protein [Verrucomicrobiae bacterium]|jgi:uncharacterized protein (DUF1501 family)